MCGRFFALASVPLSLVGASIHWPDATRPASEPQQPFDAIHLAFGATPIWFAPPSSPTMVPIVWVPWPLLSNGAVDAPYALNQL